MANRLFWSYCGIFFLAGSIILFEIAMTRVFAIMMWHHFSYMVISIALVGFGAAGSILTARRDALRPEPPFKSLAFYTMAYGIASILAFLVATRVPIDSLEIWTKKTNFLALLLIYTILSVPLILGGIAVGMALTRLAEHVNKLYFADLVGSAAGAAVSTLVLANWGNTATVMTAAAGGLLGAVLFSMAAPPSRRILPAISVLAAIGLVVGFASGALTWHIPFAPGKEMSDASGIRPEVRLPSATAEVSVAPSARIGPMIGGEFGARDFKAVDARVVTQDGTAPTMLFKNAADLSAFPFLDDTQAASAYVCRRAAGRTKPDVLVIGVGGGVDVMIALAHDARHVTAVEINSAMIEMVTDVFADYTGGFLRPRAHPSSDRIDLVHGEGRSYVRRRNERFDIIQMSGVDTFTALAMGAYTLSESYLYTVEAVKELYEHLNEDGYINYSRFILNRPRKPRETIRLANIALTALEEMGVSEPASHICVFQGLNWASTMIKRGRFTPGEMEALEKFAADEGFFGLVFDPLREKPPPPPLSAVLGMPEVKNLAMPQVAKIVRNTILPAVGATASDAEVTSLASRLWETFTARDAALVEKALADFAIWFPEDSRDRAREMARSLRGEVGHLTAGMTAGFEETRRDFSALLRADLPSRRKFMDEYEYDLSACRDDRPFFFNYYKYSGMFRKGAQPGSDWYHLDFPVGHLVLVGSLVQILVLAVILIVAPIWRLRRAGMATRGKLRYLAYFSALGLGFMFIEIVMMQKMVIFLGHPTYALSVVLTALLASTGIGSLLSARLPLRRRSAVGILCAIVVTTLGALLAANHLLPLALGQPLVLRIGLVATVLVPLGLALGMGFPTGIRVVKERCPGLLPWCWAINGLTSVFASLFCIVLALEVGFSVVMVLAAAIYVFGFLSVLRELDAPRVASPG